MLKRMLRILLVVLSVIAAVIVIAGVSALVAVRGSLPRLDGEARIAGLGAPVEVARDRLGVPDILAESRIDAARALGYLHAQDRFFQMDLQRRSASGRLSELMGAATIGMDRSVRIHRFGERARQVLEAAPDAQRTIIEAYSDGVNAGLGALGVRPFEYLGLRKKPTPWTPEDCVLTLYAMFLDLSLSTASTERMSAMVAELLPEALADYLLTPAARWDAPLQEGPPYPAPIPDSSSVDLRNWSTGPKQNKVSWRTGERELPGSNNWAVAGSLSAHGGALLANDMHLSHAIPNIWYRARISWNTADGPRALVGMTLPGAPAMVAGSNGDVAWGFTNSYVDMADLVRLEIDPADSSRYRVPEGWESFEMIAEVIEVSGSEPDTLWIRQTRWGPVWTRDMSGAPMVLRWSAHDVEAVNFALLDLEDAETVDDAVLKAAASGIPPLNFVCADAAGDIAWTVAGKVPRRAGWDGRLPVSWADGTCRWDGYLAPEDQPRIVRPEEGRIWTANNRVVGGQYYSVLGDGGYGLGARARQIRDGLRALQEPVEEDMLAIQLDDRAVYLEEWRRLALEAFEGDTAASRREFVRIIREDWTGRASTGSAGYALVRLFAERLRNIIYRSLTGPLWTKHGEFQSHWLSYRYAIAWELLQQRPPHMLLPHYHTTWDDLLLEAVDETMELASMDGCSPADYTWGSRNIVDISHPFVSIAPQLRRWLAAPRMPMPGDSNMPRVQGRRSGASERFVVSPGREEHGLFHMPGGQSGHPMSKYFLAGHEDWVEGRPSPLLPGEPEHILILKPE